MNAARDLRLWSAVVALADGADVGAQHVCAVLATVTEVDGVAATLSTGPTVRETVCVTGLLAARIEELTLTLGDGPSVDALSSGGPVMLSDIDSPAAAAGWPTFATEARALGVRALFAFPLRIGAIRLGTVTLHRRTAGILDREQLADALVLVDLICLQLLSQAGRVSGGRSDPADGMQHPEIHQATGMIIVQLGVNAENALVRLRAYAFAHDRRLRDVARDVVARRVRFDPEPEPGDTRVNDP